MQPLTSLCSCSLARGILNHEKFDTDINKTCSNERVFHHGEVPLAGVGIAPHAGLTAGVGFFFARIDSVIRLKGEQGVEPLGAIPIEKHRISVFLVQPSEFPHVLTLGKSSGTDGKRQMGELIWGVIRRASQSSLAILVISRVWAQINRASLTGIGNNLQPFVEDESVIGSK